jgi:acetyltransferase
MESVGDSRAFLSAAREVALTKPIIILKAGETEAAAHAAISHTGTLAGSDDVLEAAFRRCGVLRVHRIQELFDMAEILAKQPRPRGPRLGIVTNAGGPGVLATDALIREGGELAVLSEETVQALSRTLPPHWSHANPVDIIGDATAERYRHAVDLVGKDPNTDGLLVILTPQAMADPTQTAEILKSHAKLDGKPILASWMGGASVVAGEAILAGANIPSFPYPDAAARAFQYMWQYSSNLRALYETPVLPSQPKQGLAAGAAAQSVFEKARESRRTLLDESESKELLAAYGIPTVRTYPAASAEEAVQRAREIGFPVVLKLLSETVTHKAEVGGVRLNLPNNEAVVSAYAAIEASVREKAGPGHFQGVTVQPMVARDGYELILGSSLDQQFGPVILFGAGGELVEVLADRALGLPPLNTTLARRMMERTRIFRALQGTRRRPPVDLPALEQLLVRFSQLIIEQRRIKEIDINPLLASPAQVIALDARVVLQSHEVEEGDLPRLAIRPYPSEYVQAWTMRNGEKVILRPIRPEDEPLIVRFHQILSEESVYLRYFGIISLSQRTAHERLTRICFVDYDREMALVAERTDAATLQPEIAGVSRIIKRRGTEEAELAVLVADRFHGQGLGTELARRLVEIARREKLSRLNAEILPENQVMQHICRKLGFTLHTDMEEKVVRAHLALA